MTYDFDEIIERSHTNAFNKSGFRRYIFHAGPDKKFPYDDDEFIRMWVADMEFAVAPEIRQAMKDWIDKKIFGYTYMHEPGYLNAFRAWCRDRYGWTFDPEHVAWSAGIVAAIYQIVEDLVRPDEKVLTLAPSYGPFFGAAEYNHVGFVTSDLKKEDGRFEIDFKDLEEKASDPAVKLLLLCNPHNPTGRIWMPDELECVADIVEETGIWVVSDEIHCDLVRTGLLHTPLGKVMPDYDRLITCMSASKTFNIAGLLFSNVIIRDDAEREQFRKRDKTQGNLNPISIAAHQAAYEKGGEWLAQLKEYLDGNFRFTKEFLDANFPETDFHVPEATYLAWVDMSRVLPDVENLSLFFANNAGVLLEYGNNNFVANAEGYIRLNLAMPRAMLAEGLERMKKAILAHRAGR